VVEHKPGYKMGHVDALSRHVGSVAHDNALNKENVIREKEKDAFCIKQATGSYRSKREFFVDDDNVFYRRKSNGNHQLVVPETLVQEVIKQNYESMYVAHPGAKRTHDLIALHYWWPGMRKAVENYVRSCDPCQRRKGNREFVAPLGDVEEPTTPFEVNDLVYLFTPATKPGLTRKFRKPWKGPYQITKKISDLNYELVDQRNMKSVVHVNRLKKA